MIEREYVKPMLYDMNEMELQGVNGGAGFPVVVGVLVAALLVVAGYTVVAAATVVDVAGAVHTTLGAVTNVTK